MIPPKALQYVQDLKDYSIFSSVNQSLHFRRYGFFVSLAQVKKMFNQTILSVMQMEML